MRLHCRPLDAASAPAWDRFVESMPNGTFFHRAAWADIFASAFRHTPHFTYAERDGAITGVLPLAHVKTALFGNALTSSPFCVYGGPLAADQESFAALHAHAARVMRDTGAAVTEYRFRELPQAGWLEGDWASKDDLYVTFRKPISA